MWPTDSEGLIAALVQRGVDRERGWYGGLIATSNRLGNVDASVLDKHGHLDLALHCSEPAVKILIWGHDGLSAWGCTTDLNVVAKVVMAWQDGADGSALADSQTCIHVGTEEEAIAEQWNFMLSQGFDYLQDIAIPISEDPVLRRLRPWVSHGSLCLLLGNKPIGEDGRHLAFHDLGRGLWWLNVGGSLETYSGMSKEAAIALASRLASSWITER
ncbi:hypothetical protein Rhe02_08530 [Rhizocola hellebori]|uniref:Uncharacterized protein n=1 Tax=Rhizocola hellebori TaxID=1392758 RepID=A0A8J3VDW4_9ACTN|nr:hypothetical protein [Rhizocola hellebori]GIH02786.1 hypothetical protein Rhe02_08530 [Rhizocola hellebori]